MHSTRPSRRVLKLFAASLLAFALRGGQPAAPESPARPQFPDLPAGVTPVIDEARTHDGVTTWDLGPAPDEPGKHRYAVAIPAGGPAPEVTVPGRLGEAPVVIRLPDGRRIEWDWKLSAPLATREFAPATTDAAAGPQGAPAADALPLRVAGLLQFTREQSGTRFNFIPGDPTLRTMLRMPDGMSAEWAPSEGGGRLLLLSRGYPVANLALALSGYGAELRASRHAGEYEFSFTAQKITTATLQAAGGGPGIDGYIAPGAGWRGQMSRDNSANPNSGYVYNGTASFVGSNNGLSSIWWMRAVLQWSLSAIPQNSTIENAYLWPLKITKKYGAATTNLYIRDVTYNTAIPFPAYSAAAFDDLYAARPGHDPYLDTTVAGADQAVNLTIYSTLGHQASQDINASPRGTGSSKFEIGFSSDAVMTLPYGQYFDLDPTSVLWVYFNDYAHNQVMITGNNPFGNNGQPRSVRLYNYGEDMDITNWQISSVNYLGTTQSFTIPPVTTTPYSPRILGRHQPLDIFDTIDPSWNGSYRMITNANIFTWDNLATPGGDPLQISLIRAVGGTADYACFAGATPPANAYWNGACPSFPAGYTMYVRNRDSDTDSGADWSTIPYLTSNSLFPGEIGARRRSEVVINGLLAYGGPVKENEVELLNFGPPINLQNWSLQFYDAAGTNHGFTITGSTPVNTGERVWLVETNLFGIPSNGYPPADARHINMNFATGLGWDLNPHGGEVMLFDAGGKPRDYLVFGDRRPYLPYAYDYLNWIGGNVLVPYTQPVIDRTGDLSTSSAGDWTAGQWNYGVNGPSWFQEPGWSPGQRVINRVQDELGIQQPGGNGGYAGAHGYGSRVLPFQMVGLERIAMPAEIQMEGGVNNVRFVVKKAGSATVYYDSGPFSAPQPGVQVVTSPLISPPLILDNGYYDVMLYVNGAWSHFSGPSTIYENLSFADWFSSNGMAGEAGFTPTAATNAAISPSYPIHQWLDVIHPPLITNPSISTAYPPYFPLPDGELTVAYSFAHASSGGYGTARTWMVSAGTLPPGLAMSTAGVITGTPTLDGTYTFTVRVTDAANLYREQNEQLIVRPRLLVATSALPYYDNSSAPYSFPLQAFGGVAPMSWSCAGLPAGLACNAAGVISGTVTAAVANGPYTVTVQVTDANGLTASRVLKLVVYRTPQILTPALANGYVGYDYGSLRLVAAGGSGAPNWTVFSGALPPGLTLAAATGVITGTPTVAGSYSVTIQFANAGGTDSRLYTLRIDKPSAPNYWIRRGLSGADLDQIYYSPAFAQDQTVLAVSHGSIVLISQDGGFFWKRTGFNLRPAWGQSGATAAIPLRTIAFHPSFDGRTGFGNKTILINTNERYPQLFRSDDLGANWSPVQSVSPTNFYCDDGPWFAPSGVIYCAGRSNELPSTSSLYRSNAALTSWTALDPNPIGEFYPSPAFATDQTFFAQGRDFRLYRSTDAGAHWTDFGPLASQAGRLEFSPNFAADHAVGFISSPGGAANNYLSLSLDNGYSFNAVAQAYNPVEFHFPPTYDAVANPVLYAAGGLGAATAQMMVSNDNGVNFVPSGAGGMSAVNFSGGFRVNPTFAADQTLLAMGANGRALFRSQDAGATWAPSENGLYLQAINTVQLAPDFATSRTGFLGTDSGPYYTVNGGKVWRAAQLTGGLPSVMQIRALTVSPAYATDLTVFAQACAPGVATCRLIRSTDGGRTYAGLATLNSRDTLAYDLRVSPNYATDRILLFNARWGFTNGGKSSSFYRSTDGGVTFNPVFSFYYPGVYGFDVSPNFAADQTAYQYMNSNGIFGTYQTVDGGATWTAAPGAWPTSSQRGPRLAPTFNRVNGVNGTPSHTVLFENLKSTDAGTSFAAMHLSMTGTDIFSPNYATDNTFFNHYIGTTVPVGIYKSTDGGASSTQIFPSGFPYAFTDTRQIALSPAYSNGGADRTVLVATGSGLWTSTDGGANWALSTGTESFSNQVTAAAQDPNRSGRIYLGSLDDGIAYSNDDGETTTDLTLNLKSGGVPFQIRSLLAVDDLSTAQLGDTVLLASTQYGLYRMTVNAAGAPAASWSFVVNAGAGRRLSTDGANCFYSNAGFNSYVSAISGGCFSWSAVATNSEEIGYSAMTGPTVPLTGAAPKGGAPGIAAGFADAYWSANSATGAFHSPTGATWSAAPGTNDYPLPATAGYTSASPMGVSSGLREVALGHSTLGVFLSRDGGDTWRNVSGPGSGLEFTSRNATAFLTATTAFSTTDLLVGVNGVANGGVYLSGDGGEHWTQLNQGYDPNNLAISSLVKTSCQTCPVQYYSGSYGSGMYTRTISVNKPPFYDLAATWCAGAGCACGSSPAGFGGSVQGGALFKLCGSNFQNGMAVEFDGVPASGCALNLAVSPQTVVCTAPPHAAGAAVIRVRNPDTRARQLAQTFAYSGAVSRTINSLRVAKSGANAWASWRCDAATPCTVSAPARLYRSQNAQFSLTAANFNGGGVNYIENFNGGPAGTITGGCSPAAGNDSCYGDAGMMAGNLRSYFWTVE